MTSDRKLFQEVILRICEETNLVWRGEWIINESLEGAPIYKSLPSYGWRRRDRDWALDIDKGRFYTNPESYEKIVGDRDDPVFWRRVKERILSHYRS